MKLLVKRWIKKGFWGECDAAIGQFSWFILMMETKKVQRD